MEALSRAIQFYKPTKKTPAFFMHASVIHKPWKTTEPTFPKVNNIGDTFVIIGRRALITASVYLRMSFLMASECHLQNIVIHLYFPGVYGICNICYGIECHKLVKFVSFEKKNQLNLNFLHNLDLNKQKCQKDIDFQEVRR